MRTLLALALLAGAAFAGEIRMHDGRVLDGEVVRADAHHLVVRLADGRTVRLPKRDVRDTVSDDGVEAWYGVLLPDTPIMAAQKALLERLRAQRTLPPPDLEKLTAEAGRPLHDRLVALARDEDASIRAAAASALARVGAQHSAYEALRVALGDESADVRRATAVALATERAVAALKYVQRPDALGDALRSEDRVLRFHLGWLAGRLGDRRAIPALRPFVKDRDHHRRESAAVILAELGDDAGVRVLIGMLRRRESPAVKANADAPRSVRETLIAADRRERIRVCGLLGKLGARSAKPVLRKLASGDDEELARAAQEALERLEKPVEDGSD
jgi:hypothetical protein